MRVLRTPGYKRNVSIARLLHNHAFASAFRQAARQARNLPEIVVASMPTTDAAAVSVQFAQSRGIPAIVDVCDLWPDSFPSLLPAGLRALGSPAVAPLNRQARFACAGATSLIGTSKAYLRWAEEKGRRERLDLDRVFPLGYGQRPMPDAKKIAAFLDRIGIARGSRIVSFVGSWGVTHDFSLVVRTAERIAHLTDVRLVIAGNADAQPRARAALARLPNVVLPGWLDADEVGLLLSASAIGLLPYSRTAPQDLPNKVFEYMAYGAFQIANLRGESRELYARTRTGTTVEGGADAFAEAVLDHLQSPTTAQERAGRIAAFESNFAGPMIYGQMARHIELIAGRHASPLAEIELREPA